MLSEETLARINELARLKKKRGLTPEEAVEQKELYKVYMEFIRHQVTSQLDAAGYQPKVPTPHQCHDGCCEHHHDHQHEHEHGHGHSHAHDHHQHGPGCKH